MSVSQAVASSVTTFLQGKPFPTSNLYSIGHYDYSSSNYPYFSGTLSGFASSTGLTGTVIGSGTDAIEIAPSINYTVDQVTINMLLGVSSDGNFLVLANTIPIANAGSDIIPTYLVSVSGAAPSGTLSFNSFTPLNVTPACFVAGSMIETPTGERAVETLKVGDPVITDQGVKHIRWIGVEKLDLAETHDNALLAPYRILKNAFEDGMLIKTCCYLRRTP